MMIVIRYFSILSVSVYFVIGAALISPVYPYSLYNIGNPILNEIWIDPVNGDDNNTGISPSLALRTLTEGWSRTSNLTDTGYRLNLMAGTYSCEPEEINNCLNYFGDRHGTYEHPLIIQAVNGPKSVVIRGGFDFRNVSYLYLIDLDLRGGGEIPVNISGNNLIHFASTDHILLRGLSVNGPDCDNDQCNNLQEVLKVNQAQHFYVENSEFSGAWHTIVDYFSVQYGHFINSNLHTAGQWCMYVKGGSAYLNIEGNEMHHAFLGFQAGQSSNLALMQTPWLHYEAYDIKFINNIMHNIQGVGISVAGGYNILMAHNTLYNVGTDNSNGFPLFQAVLGERGCSSTDELPNAVSICQASLTSGGWGSGIQSDNIEAIPNRNVFVYNNIFYNPHNNQTLYSHFTVWSARERPIGFENIPDPIQADNNLVIRGNLIWNGSPNHPLGIDNDTGCTDANPACNAARLISENSINQIEPQLINPVQGDFRPLSGGNLLNNNITSNSNPPSFITYIPPDFTWSDLPAQSVVPLGSVSNRIIKDRDGAIRQIPDIPGAYTVTRPSLSDSDRIFNWLESMFPDIINPSGRESQVLGGYYYRYYTGTCAYVAVYQEMLYYLGEVSGWQIIELGSINYFIQMAIDAGF